MFTVDVKQQCNNNKKSDEKHIIEEYFILWAEFALGRVCNGPRVLWAEFVMGRDVPEP